MLRSSLMWLAALVVAAGVALAPNAVLAGGYYGSGWHQGWSAQPDWDYYGGRFVPSAMPGYLHEYRAFNANCAFLRRLVLTPVGPSWQLVPICV
jgi:hypothetical protein